MFFTGVQFDRNFAVNFAVHLVIEFDEVLSVNDRREENFRRRSFVFARFNPFGPDIGCNDRRINHFAVAAGISTTIAHFFLLIR